MDGGAASRGAARLWHAAGRWDALGYVRTKAATICRAGRDFEVHQLCDDVHLSADTTAWVRSVGATEGPRDVRMRGVWGRDGRFHPCGVALCDWWERLSNRDRRRWLLDRNRPRQLGRDGLYRYFGPAAGSDSDSDGG